VLLRSASCFVIILLLSCPASVHAATIQATTCDRAAVAAAVNSARDGDTVAIPAGRCTWATNLTITNKILTLQGAGIDITTIVDGVSKANFPNIPQVLILDTKDGGLTRVTGITFQGGTEDDVYNKGMLRIQGVSKQFRVDHCRFVATRTHGMNTDGFVYGVVDHNLFDLPVFKFGMYTHQSRWNGQGIYGDGSWADATSLGTNKAVFVEDNTFTAPSGNFSVAHDGWSGTRVVFRYNTVKNATITVHGTESSGRWRGARQFEVYNNTFTFLNSPGSFAAAIGIRSGVGVIFNNTITADGGSSTRLAADALVRRAVIDSPPWGTCNGASVWDGNTPGLNGYPCLDQIGYGQSVLLSGDNPIPVGFPRNLPEPTYVWSNTFNGATSNFSSPTTPGYAVSGRDFFNIARPGYTPYTYPHPLVTGGATPPPAAPQGLRVQ
jgi:hypothetical protein